MASFENTSIDAVQAYWDARPCNIRHSPSPVGTRQYFDEVEARKYMVEPHIPLFAQFDRWNGKKVLEIGCGIGTDTINFARAGAYVTAVDLSPKSIELAQQRAEMFGLRDHIQFHVADAEALSGTVPPEPYDLVYSFGVIHHTPHPQRIIEQIREHYAGNDTVFKCMVYYKHAWKVYAILLREGHGAFWRLEELVARNSEAETGCPITRTYSKTGVQRLLQPGFRVEDVRVEHIFPYKVADYMRYRYVRAWYIRALPTWVFRALEQRLGWHLLVTARAG